MTTTVNEWLPSTNYTIGDLIIDSSQRIQRCISPGVSGPTPPAQWATRTIGSGNPITTGDGAVVWDVTGLTALLNPGVGWYFVSA